MRSSYSTFFLIWYIMENHFRFWNPCPYQKLVPSVDKCTGNTNTQHGRCRIDERSSQPMKRVYSIFVLHKSWQYANFGNIPVFVEKDFCFTTTTLNFEASVYFTYHCKVCLIRWLKSLNAMSIRHIKNTGYTTIY